MTLAAPPGWATAHLDARSPLTPSVDWPVVDRILLQETVSRYAWAFDQRDFEAMRAVLAPDVEWAGSVAGVEAIGPFAGVDAVLEFMRAALDEQTDQRRHNFTNTVVKALDGDAATVDAYLMLTSNADGLVQVLATGFYHLTFRRTAGVWQIAMLFLGLDTA